MALLALESLCKLLFLILCFDYWKHSINDSRIDRTSVWEDRSCYEEGSWGVFGNYLENY